MRQVAVVPERGHRRCYWLVDRLLLSALLRPFCCLFGSCRLGCGILRYARLSISGRARSGFDSFAILQAVPAACAAPGFLDHARGSNLPRYHD